MESNEQIIVSVLEDLGSLIGETKRGWVHASCPLAPWKHEKGVDANPSFGVVYSAAEAKREEGHAHCFSCGYSGDVREIASLLHVWGFLEKEKLGEIMGRMDDLKVGGLPLSLSAHNVDDPFPDEAWWQSFSPIRSADPACGYLTERGIVDGQAKAFDLRFDAKRYRVVFPLHDRAQRFRGCIGRTLIKEPMGPRYFYYPYPNVASGTAPRGFTWFNEHSLDLSKPVLVVEGVMDALKAWPVYKNVTAALSVSFRTPGMGWHTSVQRWVSMFDLGKGGTLARERLEDLIAKKTGAQVWHLDPPPGRSDPGDASPSEIKAQLETLSVAKLNKGA